MFSEKKKEKEIILPAPRFQFPPPKGPNLLMFYEEEHQFIFEKNHELICDLQKYVHKFLSNANNYFYIHRSFPENILKDLIYLKEYQRNISQKEETYNTMVRNYEIKSQQISNQESLIKQIESTYIEKINDLRMENSNLAEALKKANEELIQSQALASQEKNELGLKLDYEIENSKKLLELISVTVKENSNLKEEINRLNKTLEFFTVRQKEVPLPGPKPNCETLFKSPLFFEIGKYLDLPDFLNFQQINKQIYFGAALDSKLISSVTQSLNKKFQRKIRKSEENLSFHRKRYEDIPDDYLRSSFVKFLCYDFKITDLIPSILKKSHLLIDKDISLLKEEKQGSLIEITESPAKTDSSQVSLQKEFDENNKETALDELANRTPVKNEENMEVSAAKKKPEENRNFFQKWFSKSKIEENPKGEEKFTEIIKEKRKINEKTALELIAKRLKSLVTLVDFNVNQEFLKTFEKESLVTKNKIESQMKNLNKNLLTRLLDYGNEENEENLVIFLKELLKNFCEMILFSSILVQEAKELESVKNFLLACNERAHIELFNLKDEYDDLRIEKLSEKQLKEFLSAKSKELEKKIHESDSNIFTLNENINLLNSKIAGLESKIMELTEEKKDQKNKIKTLGGEVKSLRQKNQEMENNWKNLINDCLEIKIQFEKIPMDV